jgi:hypothetical protein
MRPASGTAAFLIALSCCASVVAQPAQYNTSDTFQPGKKYNCVPTADRKGWNCNEIGKADQAPKVPSEQSAPAAAASATKPAPPSTAPFMPVAPEPIRAAPSSATTTNADRSSRLPNYLTNESATAPAVMTPPPSTISATAARANAPPVPTEERHATPIKPPLVEKPTPVVAARPATPAPPKPTPPPRETAHAANPANDDFMSLAGDHFVIELAHASRRSDLAASRDAIHIPHGEFYEVHFWQNGGDAWLLVWGSFDTIEAARSARSELERSASTPVGFPRRVAPLQAEARRVSE